MSYGWGGGGGGDVEVVRPTQCSKPCGNHVVSIQRLPKSDLMIMSAQGL